MAAIADVAIKVDARNATTQLNSLSSSVKGFAVQLGFAIGAVTTLKKSLDAAFAREASENRLRSLVNSTKEFNLAVNAAAIASKRFGVTQNDAQQALGDTLGRLKALGFNLGQVNEVYTGFNVIAREARTSTDDAAGAFLQLSQAMGRGSLQGDELSSIMERMPQLGQAIAESMGVSAASIKKLGSDGKIGLSEITATLKVAATRADQLDSSFTKQQATMALVRQRSEEIFVALGKALAPAYLTILNGMADAGFVLAGAFSAVSVFAEKNASAIKTIVEVGLKFAIVAGAVYLVVKAYEAWLKVSRALGAAQAFVTALTGPKGLVLVGAAATAATGAAILLDQAFKGVGKSIQNSKKEGSKIFESMKKETLGQLDLLARQGESTSKQVDKTGEVNRLLSEQDSILTSITAKQQLSLNATQSKFNNQLTVANALSGALLQINSLEMQRAKNSGDTAKQYQLQIQKAGLVYKQSVLQVKSEIRKAELGALQVKIEFQKLKAATMLKAAKGETTQADYEALALQQQAVQLAYEGVNAARQAAVFHLQGANALRQKTVEQAKFNATAARAGGSGGGGGGGGGLGGGGGSGGATVYGGGTRSIGSATTGSLARALSAAGVTGTFSEAQAGGILAGKRQARVDAFQAATKGTANYTSMPSNRQLERAGFAEGGYVTRPTNALIGEAGESEYVIPSSKMNSAMQRYSSGVRGEAVTAGAVAAGSTTNANYSSQQNMYYGGGAASVNITTGPVIRMGNNDYVSMSDLQRGMSTAANAGQANMMRSMTRSYGARRSMGA